MSQLSTSESSSNRSSLERQSLPQSDNAKPQSQGSGSLSDRYALRTLRVSEGKPTLWRPPPIKAAKTCRLTQLELTVILVTVIAGMILTVFWIPRFLPVIQIKRHDSTRVQKILDFLERERKKYHQDVCPEVPDMAREDFYQRYMLAPFIYDDMVCKYKLYDAVCQNLCYAAPQGRTIYELLFNYFAVLNAPEIQFNSSVATPRPVVERGYSHFLINGTDARARVLQQRCRNAQFSTKLLETPRDMGEWCPEKSSYFKKADNLDNCYPPELRNKSLLYTMEESLLKLDSKFFSHPSYRKLLEKFSNGTGQFLMLHLQLNSAAVSERKRKLSKAALQCLDAINKDGSLPDTSKLKESEKRFLIQIIKTINLRTKDLQLQHKLQYFEEFCFSLCSNNIVEERPLDIYCDASVTWRTAFIVNYDCWPKTAVEDKCAVLS